MSNPILDFDAALDKAKGLSRQLTDAVVRAAKRRWT